MDNTKTQNNKKNNKNNKNTNNNSNNNNTINNNDNSNNINFFLSLLAISIIILFLVFIYYEMIYLPRLKKQQTIVKNNKIEILKPRDSGKPYKFKQSFGSSRTGSTVVNTKGNKVKNMDKTLYYSKGLNCADTLHNISIHMNIKFPYIYPNKDWNSSYRDNKPIISFGSSPTISYNPYKNKLIITFQHMGFNNRRHTYSMEVDVYLQKWIDLMIVIETRKVKVYINRKLIKYDILPNVPILNFNNSSIVKIGEYNNNFNGEVNNITLHLDALTTSEIQKLK